MRILTISNCPLVYHQGSGYIITNFCDRLAQRGHQVDVFGPDDFEVLQGLRPRANSYRLALGMLTFVIRQMRCKPYDIIEFYGAQAWLAVLILRLLPRRSVLLVSHSNGIEPHFTEVAHQNRHLLGHSRTWYQLEQTALLRHAFTKVDGLVTVSHYDGDYARQQRYLPDNRLLVIENSLPDSFLQFPIGAIAGSRAKTIGFCGSWLPRKGTELIKVAIPRLLEEFPEWTFKLIGVGHGFKKDSMFPSSICSQIEVIPSVNDKPALREIYQSMAILVVPSIYESFGLVTAEAMSCGCAVVASATGFAASLKPGEEALVLDELTPTALYQAVRKLVLNESLRQQISRCGHQRVQRLRWDSAVESLEKTYLAWLHDFRMHLS